MICGLAAASSALTFIWTPPLLFVWNASASSPEGLYRVDRSRPMRRGDTAIAWPPPGARQLAARRRYLPASVPLVKNVAATSGERICAIGRRVTIDGRQAALRQSRDRSGRQLPWWTGCIRLRPGQLFLLSPNMDAFDGRYFGVTRASDLVGSGKLLWRR